MTSSSRALRIALAALALAALLGAPRAARAAGAASHPAAVVSAGGVWDQLVAAVEARLAGLLRFVGPGGAGATAPKRAPAVPGVAPAGDCQAGSGARCDQSPGQDPNG